LALWSPKVRRLLYQMPLCVTTTRRASTHPLGALVMSVSAAVQFAQW